MAEVGPRAMCCAGTDLLALYLPAPCIAYLVPNLLPSLGRPASDFHFPALYIGQT